MIQKTVSFGHTSSAQLRAQTLDVIEDEFRVRNDSFRLLTGMDIASKGDVVSADDITTPVQTLAMIPHGLGYPPLFLVYRENNVDEHQILPFFLTGSGFGGVSPGNPLYNKIGFGLRARADSSYLYIEGVLGFVVSASAPVSGWRFRYYIFKQPQA